MQQSIEEKIRQRRSQMLIHSYLYYELDEIIVDDHVWQKWANELRDLQAIKSEIGFYDAEFKGWDGSTGHHLPKPLWVENKARELLFYHKNPMWVQEKRVKLEDGLKDLQIEKEEETEGTLESFFT